MKKVYMAADGWLNSDVRYPYLIAIGTEKPMYRANAFMLMNPRDTGDNEKSCGAPGYYSSRIGTWNYLFTILKNINEQWTDSTPQIRIWSLLPVG